MKNNCDNGVERLAFAPFRSKGSRKVTVEIGKLFCSLCIVWFHTAESFTRLTYSALPVFLLLSILLTKAKKDFGNPWYFEALGNARKLLLPWLIWSAFYGILKFAKAFFRKEPVFGWFEVSMVGTGFSLHLWYLPMLFVVMEFIAFLDRKHLIFGPSRALFSIFLGIALIVIMQSDNLPSLGPPMDQWLVIFPFACLGISLRAIQPVTGCFRWNIEIFAILALLAISAIAGYSAALIGFVALVSTIIMITPRWVFRFDLTRLSLAIYLAHPIIASVIGDLMSIKARSDAVAGITVVIVPVLCASFLVGKEFAIAAINRFMQTITQKSVGFREQKTLLRFFDINNKS
jgi:hypothetical protein